MPTGIFAQRERALENEFFHRVDQQLLQNLRDQAELETDERALAAATGIDDQRILDELIAVGIRIDTLQAFRLFPAIYVAWCDRVLDTKERGAVLSAADRIGFKPDSHPYKLIAAWLKQPPSAELITAWKDYVESLCTILSYDALENLKDDTLGTAKRIAKVSGGLLGLSAISAKEADALQELEAAFAVGHNARDGSTD